MPALLQITDLRVDFDAPGGSVRVVNGVDLEIKAGEILGLVGESGSGKSVSCLSVLRLAGPRSRTAGKILYDGEDLVAADDGKLERLRGREISMIFQDPASSLNPVVTIGQQVGEAVRLNRPELRNADPKAIRTEVLRLLREVGIAQPEDRYGHYPHELSGGQNQRVMIAMMLAGAPRLLIADEPTTALDVTIQAQILSLLVELSRQRQMALILVTHDLGVVAQTCQRVAVMYCGSIVEVGPVASIFAEPRHPYTFGLLQSRPRVDHDGADLPVIEGAVPDPGERQSGCAFAPRCSRRVPVCDEQSPHLGEAVAHRYACFNPVAAATQ